MKIKRKEYFLYHFPRWPVGVSNHVVLEHYAGGPRRPPPPQLQLWRSRDLAHASIPLAQTPRGLTGRAWLQAGAQQAVIAVDPSFKSLGIDSRNVFPIAPSLTMSAWSAQSGVGAAKHHRQNAYLTAMFGHYIGGYFKN